MIELHALKKCNNYLIESIPDSNFSALIQTEVQLWSLIVSSQVFFPYLPHRFSTMPTKIGHNFRNSSVQKIDLPNTSDESCLNHIFGRKSFSKRFK